MFLTLLLSACTQIDSSLEKESTYYLVEQHSGEVEYFSSYSKKKTCPAQAIEQSVNYFNDDQQSLEKININLDNNDKSLINKIYYHSELDFIDDLVNDEGIELELCMSQKTPENSIEQIAINMFDIIKRSKKVMTQVDQGYTANPVNILIHPQEKSFLKRENTDNSVTDFYKWETDNISYKSFKERKLKGPSIIIYPRSQQVLEASKNHEIRSPFSGQALWSFPFVLMHEYGHHVLSTYIWRETYSLNHTNHFSVIGESSRTENQVLDTKEKKLRLQRFASELYADLFSYYSLPRKYTQFKNSLCLEYDRDLESPIFYSKKSNVSKVLNRNRLNIFKTIGNQAFKPPCNLVFTDIYKIGAIFSHFIYSINSQVSLGPIESLKVVNKTFRYIGQAPIGLSKLAAAGQVEEYLVQFIKLYLAILGDELQLEAEPYPEIVCRLVEEKFPAMYENIIDINRTTCRIKLNSRD